MGRKPPSGAAQLERSRTMIQRSTHHELNSRREIDKLMAKLGTMPQILCWNCHKLTRSEEHTSELQSRSDLVCRLLLEKKKPSHYLTTYLYRPPSQLS